MLEESQAECAPLDIGSCPGQRIILADGISVSFGSWGYEEAMNEI
jgi:hypothetical protein